MNHGDSDGLFEICESLPACYLITDDSDRVIPLTCCFIRVFEWMDPRKCVVWVAVVEAFATVSHRGCCQAKICLYSGAHDGFAAEGVAKSQENCVGGKDAPGFMGR